MSATALLFQNALVIPMTGTKPFRGAVGIAGNRIALVSADETAVARFRRDHPACRTIDCTGRAVLPGLIDTHCHAAMTLQRSNADDIALMAWLNDHIWPFEARQTDDDIRVGALLGAAEMLLGGVTIFIFVERFVAIRKATRIDDNFMNRIRDYIWEGKINSAVDLCRRTDSPVARMIEKGIERIGRPMGDIQTSIENVANLEVAKLEKGLPTLATIAGGAPMIGFLGTVVGMVEVFISMSANTAGGINIGDLSSGMYTAMVTTVGGLIVGIPAYFAHNYLVARIEKLVFHMEATSIAFMDILNQPVQK